MSTRLLRSVALALALVAGLLLVSCARDRPRDEAADGPSSIGLKPSDIADATPRAEAPSRYGNHSPYKVFGRSYHVMDSARGYRERGIASWYGSKFHGRRTSSGEPYDMHLATAAHKSLPLPTYAEVTNLANGKKVIVKINDRGPFKDDRLIDLSYGAALRLGMIGAGTAPVEVRVIDVFAEPPPDTTVTADAAATWLQAGAYGRREGAEQLAGRLERAQVRPVSINDAGALFRVWLGPYDSQADIDAVIRRVVELGFDRPHRVKR
ncbi:MAG: septal ring lytic transglycosylase RlpA family protein [Xanthomonadales bacterium]|nr:septal ring lytic transglycosylase RlpA family protein [Xanthomonadales bacterium]